MTPFEVFDLVRLLERVFPVERLSLGGVNHWMVIRLLLLGNLARYAALRTREIAGTAAHSRMIDNPLAGVTRSRMMPTSYQRRLYANLAILFEPPQARSEESGMIFFELPVDYTQVIEGRAVNRIADGFVEEFGSSVRKVCRFSPDLLSIDRRVEPSFVFLAPPALDLSEGERSRFTAAVRDFCRVLYEQSPELALTPGQILGNVSNVLSQAVAHEAWLREVKPNLVAFQSFISMEKMAVLVACKRLGIRTVEVQHGYCDNNSIFNEMPPGDIAGFNIFTDVFWCWGERSVQALKADSGFLANNVEVVLGGDVWGARAKKRAQAEGSAFLSRIKAENYSRRILLAHQIEALLQAGEHKTLMPEFVLQAMLRAPSTWLWMVRVHPRSSHLIKPIMDLLAASRITNCEVEVTSLAPIEVVLDVADVYLTGFSVSAFEANAVQKPVILLDPVGKRLLSDLVERNVFGYADNADDLCAQLESIAPPTIDAGYYLRDLGHSRQAIDSLLSTSAEDGGRFPAEPASPEPAEAEDGGRFPAEPASPEPAEAENGGRSTAEPASPEPAEAEDGGRFPAEPASPETAEAENGGSSTAKPASRATADH